MTQVMESAGMQFLNRTHARTFTLNIFQMNALELMEATRRVRDPDQGLFLMSQQNKEAGQQAHRELSRHMHNFLAAAKTLVDHTRVFIDENYAGTHIFQNYQDQIKATFVDDGASKFVHDLRNYMLHKGMPPSRMFLHISSNPAETENPHDLETGIQLDVGSLLEWSSWTAPARRYLEAAGEHLDIHQFVEEYLVRVNRFQSWLDAMLQEHHQEDLRKLEDLRKELAIRRPFQSENRPIAGEYSEYSPVARFEFVPDHSAQLNDLANSLFSRIRELHFAKKPAPDFPTERPIAANLTEADFKGTPKFWGPDAEGVRVFAFIRKDQKIFGLTEADYNSLDGIASKVLEVEWAANSLSREFIEEAFISWSQERFESDHDTFEDALLVSAKKSVLPLEIWMPIANLEVEGGFEFGPVRIEPITSSRLDVTCPRKIPPV